MVIALEGEPDIILDDDNVAVTLEADGPVVTLDPDIEIEVD